MSFLAWQERPALQRKSPPSVYSTANSHYCPKVGTLAVVIVVAAAVVGLLALVAFRPAIARQSGLVVQKGGEVVATGAEGAAAIKATIEDPAQLLARARQALGLEYELGRRLRAGLAELYRERGVLGDTSDVRALVLQITVDLLGAEKGILLSRLDEDGDGSLDLVCAQGFEHDPDGGAVTQHFAALVIEQDRTIRVENPGELSLAGRTPADDEIDNLCAIPIYLHDRFSGAVICANSPDGFSEYDDEVLLAVGYQAGTVLQNARLQGRLRQTYLATVEMLAGAIEAKDRELSGHSTDVSTYVLGVAKRLGLEPGRRERLHFAALLHDVGKIGISERILQKPGPLTPEERAIVEQHSRIGFRLVEQVPELRELAPAILHHHERWDGDGYPDKLRGEDIPLEARLIGVADAFSAMLAERPYRAGMSVEEACGELKRCAGSQFDPEVVRLFSDEVTRTMEIAAAVDPLSVALADPELDVRRDGEQRLLGARAIAASDTLPVLYSHRHLHETAAAEAARAEVRRRPFAVILVSLPGLRDVNEQRGYAAGDEVLRTLAEGIERVASRCGGTAARESGARLCLLVPGADGVVAEQLADELAAELAERNGATRLEVRYAVWEPGDSGDAVIARARERGRLVAKESQAQV